MKARIVKYWDLVRSSFWFTPSLMAAAAAGLAFGTVSLDETLTQAWLKEADWIYAGGAEGASLVLSTIAGSMITIAGVVFSMTLVALSLASAQLGPRLLRNFMRDTTNQVVLGTFVATFVYCLLVLRTIRRPEEGSFVPHLSVTTGVLLAVASIMVLIYFIHHISISIQADEGIARVGRELIAGIDELFPEGVGREPRAPAPQAVGLPQSFERDARTIPAGGDGYLQFIDADALMELAERQDVLLRLDRRPGQYAVKGTTLARAWPADRVTEKFSSAVEGAFALGSSRTSIQDIGFPIDQLVEIAVRALSPGVNDPHTALACVDRLGSALYRLAQREMPSPHRMDRHGRLRIVTTPVTFAALTDDALTALRHHLRSDPAVTRRLLETIALLGTVVHRAEDRAALRHHAGLIARSAGEGLTQPEDLRALDEHFRAVSRALGES